MPRRDRFFPGAAFTPYDQDATLVHGEFRIQIREGFLQRVFDIVYYLHLTLLRHHPVLPF